MPKTGIYSAVGLSPREQARYDAADSALDDRELAQEGEREMDVLRTQPQHASTIPSQQAIHTLASQGNAAVQQSAQAVAAVAQAQHQMAQFEGNVHAITGGSSGQPGLMAGEVNVISRARLYCVGLVLGAIGIALGATAGVMTALKLTGYFDAAKTMASGGSGATPSHDELDIWFKLPNDSFFKLIWAAATRQGYEWSFSIWNYVTTYLSQVCATSIATADQPAFSKLLVDDATLDADFQDWNDNQKLDPEFIFNKSEVYQAANNTGIDPVLYDRFARGARLDYLSRIFAKGLDAM
jgi:hypothetical protein